MKNTWNKAGLALISGSLLLASCDKEDTGAIEGVVPTADFTAAVNTTEFPTVVTFTNTSQNGFLYQWEFGDNSTGSGETVTHTYPRGGTYKVRLTAAGRGGTGTSPEKDVVVPSPCANASFGGLTDCAGGGVTVWTYSRAAGAIEILAADDRTVISSSAANSLPACQADDQFSFSSGYQYIYKSGGQTSVNGACATAADVTTTFRFRPNGNGPAQFVLQAENAFAGTSSPAAARTYDIVEATAGRLRLKSTNANGTKTVVTLVTFNATDPIRQLLTGGASKTWMLDNTIDAPIQVGTEANPLEYFAGVKAGELPACQSDDEYTFSATNTLTYNAKAETFSAAAGFTCQPAQSGTSAYSFGPASGTGLAQFVLARTNAFIGTTDASPTERVYRIISIDENKMTLRAGSGSSGGTVFTMKFVAKR